MIMEFSINSTSEILNIWARGELEITTNLEEVEFIKYKNDDNIYLVNNTNSKEISFKVTSKQGDYINVGYSGFVKSKDSASNNYFSSSELIKDGYVITGYLNRKIMDEYCYNFENFTGEDGKVFGTGISFDKFLTYVLSRSSEDSGEQNAGLFKTEMIYVEEVERYQTICFHLSDYNNESLYNYLILFFNLIYQNLIFCIFYLSL